MIKIVKSNPLFLAPVEQAPIVLNADDYKLRLEKLVDRIGQKKLDYVIIYGDREHFSNIEYFSGYDCRFEEALLIVDSRGKVSMIVGNEGWGYCQAVPYDFERYLYQNFSLQGQPRNQLKALEEILGSIGITENSVVGIVGWKYFELSDISGNPEQTYDLPMYILETIQKVTLNHSNFTKELTGLPDGIRMRLHTAKEVAWAEAAGNRCANIVQELIKNLKIGIKDYELPALAKVGFDPHNSHPLVNFGWDSVKFGMRSPAGEALVQGTSGGVCYGIRGNLTSRISVLAADLDSCGDLEPYIESFYMKHFEAMSNWYEAAAIDVTGGELYDAVMSVIGDPSFGVTLNPTHNTGTDEWVNSPCHRGSKIPVVDGSFIQVDIIASASNPNRTAICEDAVVFAGEKLRSDLAEKYPEVYSRIKKRQQAMRETLGINIRDEILPMSNLNGANFPFLLNTSMVFSK